MDEMSTFGSIALGVLVAVVYPVLLGFVRNAFPATAERGLPPWVKKYGGLLLFSLVTAFIVLGVFRTRFPDATLTFWPAFFLGFGWESSLEKLLTPPGRPSRA
jgi:protein-S-isoprenylcysteine O-methyltransferase Ste14